MSGMKFCGNCKHAGYILVREDEATKNRSFELQCKKMNIPKLDYENMEFGKIGCLDFEIKR